MKVSGARIEMMHTELRLLPVVTILLATFLSAAAGCGGSRQRPAPPEAAIAGTARTIVDESPGGVTRETPEPAAAAESEWSNSIGMRFRNVPPGDVDFAVPREGPLDQLSAREQYLRKARGEPPLPPAFRRPVRITQPFAMSVCEVAFAEFEKVMRKGVAQPSEPDRPVGVSWEEAAEFCRRLSELPEEKKTGRTYRLPTQAEWQLAEPEGDECYPWHLTVEHVSVWNWCLDLFDPEYYRAMPDDTPTLDPRGAESGTSHVVQCAYSHPDPFRRLMAFRVVTESPP